jgi:hypothetical protein
MAGRRPREAVKETLISNGGGEFNEETHVHLLPVYCNFRRIRTTRIRGMHLLR